MRSRLVRVRRSPLRGALPTTLNARTNEQTLEDGFAIPSQVPPEPIEQYDPGRGAQPDIRWQEQARRASEGIPNFDPEYNKVVRHIVHPGGLPLTNFSGFTLGATTPGGPEPPKIVFQRHPDRRRFILCNPASPGTATLFFYFKNSLNGPIPLFVGQVWDESGSEISTDDIWIAGADPGGNPVPYVAYEGRLRGDYDV